MAAQAVWELIAVQFLEIFAQKHISSSEDRLEESKRRKLAIKAKKLVELMMVSGIPTASGYEERIRFSELEVVDRGAQDQGLLVNAPEGNAINGWDVNVAGVRTTSVKRTVRYHQHAVSCTMITANPCDADLPRIGIHHPRTKTRHTRSFCRTKVWPICETTQAAANRASWQSTPTVATKEQNLHRVHVSWRRWRRRCFLRFISVNPEHRFDP